MQEDRRFTTDLYFESHITIEPVYDERLEQVKEAVKPFGFRVADLLMKKRKAESPTRSAFDTFCTSRDTNYTKIEAATTFCVMILESMGVKVYRYKIENTLLDERILR